MTATQIQIISRIASALLFYKIKVVTSKWGGVKKNIYQMETQK